MSVKDTFFSKKQTLNFRGKLMSLAEPKIMGIVNVTPDSFYAESRKPSKHEAIAQADKLLNEGADILDIGAYSSRPGAEEINENEELQRLEPVIEQVRIKHPDAIISVDTFRSGIAKKMLNEYDVDMINDISAGVLDPEMIHVVAEHQVPYVMMHMKGAPRTMQKHVSYKNVVKEVMLYFAKKIDQCKKVGIHDVIIDPGFGFGKNIEHNFQLLRQLKNFEIFELPLLVGVSRKSMIYKTISQLPEEAITGTTVLHTIALQKGASMLRVHDVKEARETIQIMKKYNEQEPQGGDFTW